MLKGRLQAGDRGRQDGVLAESLLGRVIDDDVIQMFEQSDVDLAGEQGEYHTVVVDGPIFRRPATS